MSHTLEATFDRDVFRPDKPVGLRPNTRVRLIVEPAEAPEDSRRLSCVLPVRSNSRVRPTGPPIWTNTSTAAKTIVEG